MWAMLEHNCPEQLVMKINALYLIVFTAYKIDHLINEIGINNSLKFRLDKTSYRLMVCI
ncbi:hypothetical protein [Thalassotalea piscium]|uniref:Uncharacterized protein n=1 Tax=Thalassotalea piscium TaxID=1230533 RepID=A0A7X0TV03_9GAMM|nr:hypothetical protein [Thalassotalea piscium]MBB6544831.1 hypothetical protein [Thalassotalea piscium]